MSELPTTIHKGRNGFEALTKVPLPGVTPKAASMGSTEPAGPMLRIETGKSSRGGLRTFACVVNDYGHGFSFAIPGDFSKTVAAAAGARCTEKTVKALHESALAKIAEIEAEARAFYEKEKAIA